MATTNLGELNRQNESGPRLERSFTLHFQGDWGMANFHRICSWLSQQFCDRTGPRSQVAIWNLRDGGLEAVTNVSEGRVHLSISTPAQLMTTALTGQGIFQPYGPMPSLRALGVLPQDDRMVLAISPKYNIRSFAELRQQKPALRIATSHNDGTNFIGYVASEMMKAHGIDDAELKSWGGEYITATRPEEAMALVMGGKADALLQEAIMTPWWESVIEEKGFIPLPAEPTALVRLADSNPGATQPDASPLPAGFWPSLREPLPCLDFADFVVLVRDDLPEEVAHLLTWCLVETRASLEGQYHHLRPEKSPLTYPLEPEKMARSPVPLHPGAYRYYKEAGIISLA
ncbi:hypothetical protein EDB81DRAFT_797605 [Dactylonectria macrodidyma]|uniref:Uncharacterized protein n=1 Tax=Dactylonectria macrodidyma TaxID=307937 RepID=A0A9P9J4J7_9HYPO|nr:hypothetical protein EDB81DRAFT_797605 [Dactylonectria macrodidyma]